MQYQPAQFPLCDGKGETADCVAVFSARIAVASTPGYKGYDKQQVMQWIDSVSLENTASLSGLPSALAQPMLAALTASTVFEEWQIERARQGKTRMTGLVLPALGVFSWQDGENFAGMIEPNAVLSLSSHPELSPAIRSLEEFREAVNDLAQMLGTRFDQVRVYVLESQESLRILQRGQGNEAPTAGGEDTH